VGSPSAQLLGSAIVTQFGLSFDWPLGAALAFALIGGMAVTLAILHIASRLVGLRERPA
jgi:ABC-type spermidine/putrescine transport system permease subunit I